MRTIRKTPTVSREEYTMRALEKAFPTGEWVQEVREAPAVSRANGEGTMGDGRHDSPASLTIIGGTKYDEDNLEGFLSNLPEETQVIVGAGRGSETWAAEWWREVQFEPHNSVTKIAPDPDRYGKSARKVNVEQVLSHDLSSPVLLVGTGERVKQAKEWLKRTLSKREVIELP